MTVRTSLRCEKEIVIARPVVYQCPLYARAEEAAQPRLDPPNRRQEVRALTERAPRSPGHGGRGARPLVWATALLPRGTTR